MLLRMSANVLTFDYKSIMMFPTINTERVVSKKKAGWGVQRLKSRSIFQKVDKIARAGDVETMEGILEILIEKHGLEERVDKFNQKQEEGNLSSMNWRI